MTVDLMDESGYHLKRSKLGQDPLREDADPDALWDKFRSARKSVGLALMDQAMFAGVGNIYRAEILYKAGVHPEQPCADLDRAQFDVVWRHTVELLQRGFVNGSILTVDPEEAAILSEPWTRRYVYNQSLVRSVRGRRQDVGHGESNRLLLRDVPAAHRGHQAASARGETRARNRQGARSVRVALRAGRCGGVGGGSLQAHRRQAQGDPRRDGLARRGAQTQREKADLVALLRAATATAKGEKTDADAVIDLTDEVTAPRTPAKPSRTTNAASKSEVAPSPGTRALESMMNSAEAAAMEKLAAGEKGNVEHVALADDKSRAVIARAKRRARRRGRRPPRAPTRDAGVDVARRREKRSKILSYFL